jgi:chromosome segregation protein
VRGKDIQLLFADARPAPTLPALVRQGQISELIGSKPQNRRRILEEAAGIGGPHQRRHEAELKLNGAEANLERLSEVSAEVERQLASLKRQAGKRPQIQEASPPRWTPSVPCSPICAGPKQSSPATPRRTNLDEAKRAVEDLTRADAVAEKERVAASDGLDPASGR